MCVFAYVTTNLKVCDLKLPNIYTSVACQEGQFKCAHGNKCISGSWKCDKEDDCGDNSDEVGCPGTCRMGDYR